MLIIKTITDIFNSYKAIYKLGDSISSINILVLESSILELLLFVLYNNNNNNNNNNIYLYLS